MEDTRRSSSSPHHEGTPVSFTWPASPNNKIVRIAGTFTSWESVDMTPPPPSDSVPFWTFATLIQPGVHEYKFVVDGEWVHDETKECTNNNVGSKNNILRIPNDLRDGDRSSSESSQENTTTRSTCSDNGVDRNEWEVVEQPASGYASQSSHTSSIEHIEAVVVGGIEEKQKNLSNGNASPTVVALGRKFALPLDYSIQRLEDKGFERVENEFLHDVYYDFPHPLPGFFLMCHDYWLCRRNGDWKLKYPVVSSLKNLTGAPLYHETSDPKDILGKMKTLLTSTASDPMDEEVNLTSMLETGVLKAFAKLRTERKYFKKENVNIVMEVGNLGYAIGEIEIVLENQDITLALQNIQDIAKSLDFSPMMDLRVGNSLVL